MGAAVPLNAESAIFEVLRETDQFPGVRMATMVPAHLTARVPFLHAVQVDGRLVSPVWRRGVLRDAAFVNLHVWHGPDTAAARQLCRQILAALIATPTRGLSDGSTWIRCVHTSGPAHQPDPYGPESVWRYVMSVAVHTH